MLGIFCRDRHPDRAREEGLCPACRDLLAYVLERLECCPYGEKKPTCAECPIHCYAPDRRAEIRAVMAHAGPRLLFERPILALRHAIDGRRAAAAADSRRILACLLAAVVLLHLPLLAPLLHGRMPRMPVSDVVQFTALQDYVVDEWRRAGSLPEWNPYFSAGLPVVGAAGTAPFHPARLLDARLGADAAVVPSYLIHAALAATGMWLWLRASGRSGGGALVGAVVCVSSATFANFVAYGDVHAQQATAWYLLAGAGIVGYGAGLPLSAAVAGAVAYGIGSLAFSPEIYMFFLYAVVPLSILAPEGAPIRRRLVGAAIVLLGGFALSMPETLSYLQALPVSGRSIPGVAERFLHGGGYADRRHLVEALLGPGAALPSGTGGSLHAAPLAWILAAAAGRRGTAARAALAGLLLVLLMGFSETIYERVAGLLPGVRFLRMPQRVLRGAAFFLPVLAALGWDRLADRSGRPPRGRFSLSVLLGLLGLLGLAAVGCAAFGRGLLIEAGRAFGVELLARGLAERPYLVLAGAAAWPSGLLVAGLARPGLRAAAAAAAIAVLCVAPSRFPLLGTSERIPDPPLSPIVRDGLPVRAALAVEGSRFSYSLHLLQIRAFAGRMPQLFGYLPMTPRELILAVAPDPAAPPPALDGLEPGDVNPALLPRLGVGLLGVAGGDEAPPPWLPAGAVGPEARDGLRWWRLPDAAPLVSAEPEGDLLLRRYEPGIIEARVEMPRAGAVVLRENLFPGWSAWVDGAPSPLESEGPFIRVPVPAGAHEVRLSFRNPAVHAGSWGAAATAAALSGGLLLRRRRHFADAAGRAGESAGPAARSPALRLAEWTEHLPASEAVVRVSEAAWLRSLGIGGRVLDVGCGDGLFAALAFRDPLLVGTDRSFDLLPAARASGAYRFVVQADVRRLPFRSERFAWVVSNGALEHVPGVEKGLEEIARVLPAGGRLAMTAPGPRCGGADRAAAGAFVPPWETALNRIWGHVNLWPPSAWNRPEGAWRTLDVRPYLGPRRYGLCVLFFWLGGPLAAAVRRLTGRRVLSRRLRRPWALLFERLAGPDDADLRTAVSNGILLERTGALPSGDVLVREAMPGDERAIAEIDLASRPGDLLTSLGLSFSVRLHRALIASPHARVFVAVEDGRVVGFVAGAPNAAALYRRLLLRDGLGLAARGLPHVLLHPREIPRIASILRYAGGGGASPTLAAELVVMGVRAESRRRGAARRLWGALAERLRGDRAPGFFLVVRSDNAAARRFYEAVGMSAEAEERISGGPMLRYAVRWPR